MGWIESLHFKIRYFSFDISQFAPKTGKQNTIDKFYLYKKKPQSVYVNMFKKSHTQTLLWLFGRNSTTYTNHKIEIAVKILQNSVIAMTFN